jgi:L,D-transpeptidase ErfK/SrfK
MRAVVIWSIVAVLGGALTPAAGLAPSLAGAPVDYCVVKGDSLDALAARFGVDATTIARRNGLEPKRALAAGSTLRIDAVHIVPAAGVAVVVNVPQRMLFVTTADTVHAFPIAVGRRGWETPRGAFTIAVKEEDPTWDVPVSIQAEMRRAGKTPVERVPPSPANPLGAYWIGLSLPGIGIHGTNAPRSVYRFATHGCIRVHPERVGEVFALVETGMTGVIVYEPLLVAVVDGGVFVEAHSDTYGRAPVTIDRLRAITADAGAAAIVDWARAGEALRLREGVAVDVTRRW